jgi:hypothetical protein
MTRCALALVTAALAAAFLLGAGGASDRAALLDTGRDEIARRVAVPSADRRHGEVRIVHRGPHVVVQTLLYSKVLSRVIGEIAEKEARGWPDGKAGHEDSRRYVEALRRARDEAPKTGADDRRRKLRIDFVDGAPAPFVAITGVELEEQGSALRIAGTREPTMILDLSATYVRANMRLIVADAFHVSAAEAEAMLAGVPGK